MRKAMLGAALAAAAFAVGAGQFGSAPSPRGEKLRLTCEGPELLLAECALEGIGKDGKRALPSRALRFSEPSQDVGALREAASTKRDKPLVGDVGLDAQSVARLDAIDWERCFASKQERYAVLCAPPGLDPEWAVLFLRGTCARCTFEPIVLRKE